MNRLIATGVVLLSLCGGVRGAVTGLPIGSTNVVADDTLKNVSGGFTIQVLTVNSGGSSFSSLRPAEEVTDIPAPEKRTREGMESLLSERIAKYLKGVLLTNETYATRRFAVNYVGRAIRKGVYPAIDGWNEFSLERNSDGKLVIPEIASRVDIGEAALRPFNHTFFVEGVTNASLEVLLGSSRIATKLKTVLNPQTWNRSTSNVQVDTRDGAVGIYRDYVVGAQEGRLTLWYRNGDKWVFNLKDGAVFEEPSFSVEVRLWTFYREISPIWPGSFIQAVIVGVKGPVNKTVVLECSSNLRDWKPLGTTILSYYGLADYYDDYATSACRVYRARLAP